MIFDCRETRRGPRRRQQAPSTRRFRGKRKELAPQPASGSGYAQCHRRDPQVPKATTVNRTLEHSVATTCTSHLRWRWKDSGRRPAGNDTHRHGEQPHTRRIEVNVQYREERGEWRERETSSATGDEGRSGLSPATAKEQSGRSTPWRGGCRRGRYRFFQWWLTVVTTVTRANSS